MLALWFLTLLSCQYLEEQRTLPDTVTWDGYVLAQVSTMAETQVLAEGAVTLLDLDGNVLREGLQDPNTPGYWGFEEVPVATEVAILVEGLPGGDAVLPELTPTVWRGLSPSGRASWPRSIRSTVPATSRCTCQR